MANLKTTAEERARLHKSAQFNMWLPGSATLTMQALDDLDTLLAENARLRAAEAVLRALVACDDAIAAGREPPTSRRDLAAKARAALGEP